MILNGLKCFKSLNSLLMKMIRLFLKKIFYSLFFLSTCLSANEIDKFINDYFDAFNRSDSIKFHNKFHNPFIRIINGEKKLTFDEKWFNFSDLNSTDWSYSSILDYEKFLETDNEAIVKINYGRHNSEGSIYNSGYGYMVLTKINDKWGISTYIAPSIPIEGIK